ncbi:hypothetical protein Tco_0733155 [Tanacetum coccineum]
MKEMRDGCNKYGEPHPSSDCDDRPMGGPKEEKANYASEISKRNRRNDYVRNSYPIVIGKTYNPSTNPNTKTAVFLDDSEAEAEEVEKEVEPQPKIPTQTDTSPLKAYKPKIPYP